MAWSSRTYGRSSSAQAAVSCVATINSSSTWGQIKVERQDCKRPQNGWPNKHPVQLTQDRQKWKNVCASKINSIVTSRVELENAQISQKARDRADPSRCQDQQHLLCTNCKRLFKSQTGGKRHNCNRGQNHPDPQERAKAGIKCDRCSRLFTRESDKKRQKCHQCI